MNQVCSFFCKPLTTESYLWQICQQAHLGTVALTAQLEVKYSGNPSKHYPVDYE